MVEDVKTLNANLTIKDIHEGLEDKKISGYPVMNRGLLFGMISTNEINKLHAKDQKDIYLSEVCERKIISIYQDQSLLVALHKLKRFHVSRLPVVSRINEKRLVGIITAENIVSQFGYHIAEDEDDTEKEDHEVAIALNASLEEQQNKNKLNDPS